MPPTAIRAGGKLRRLILVVAVVLLAAAAYAFIHLGSFLAAEDPLEKADAIVVLSGTAMSRQLEGADLYRAGYAPRIVLTRDVNDAAFEVLARQGIAFPTDAERARDVYRRLGIPSDAIILPDTIHANTAAEAITVRALASTYGWRRVIVVTSKYHLRRAGFAFRRELGDGVLVVMHGSRYDRSQPQRWWGRRADFREVAAEAPRLLAYMAGLGA